MPDGKHTGVCRRLRAQASRALPEPRALPRTHSGPWACPGPQALGSLFSCTQDVAVGATTHTSSHSVLLRLQGCPGFPPLLPELPCKVTHPYLIPLPSPSSSLTPPEGSSWAHRLGEAIPHCTCAPLCQAIQGVGLCTLCPVMSRSSGIPPPTSTCKQSGWLLPPTPQPPSQHLFFYILNFYIKKFFLNFLAGGGAEKRENLYFYF